MNQIYKLVFSEDYPSGRVMTITEWVRYHRGLNHAQREMAYTCDVDPSMAGPLSKLLDDMDDKTVKLKKNCLNVIG